MVTISNMKIMVIEIKEYQSKEELHKIRPYLKDINNLKKSNTWKIQLTLAIKFISSKDTKKKHVIQSKSDNIEIMTYDKA